MFKLGNHQLLLLLFFKAQWRKASLVCTHNLLGVLTLQLLSEWAWLMEASSEVSANSNSFAGLPGMRDAGFEEALFSRYTLAAQLLGTGPAASGSRLCNNVGVFGGSDNGASEPVWPFGLLSLICRRVWFQAQWRNLIGHQHSSFGEQNVCEFQGELALRVRVNLEF